MLVVELGNKAEAYRQSYNTNGSAQVCAVAAQKLLDDANIALRVDEHRNMVQEKHNVTVESLMKELEESRILALTCETPQCGAANSATMGKAKLAGLDKQIIEATIRVTDSGGNSW